MDKNLRERVSAGFHDQFKCGVCCEVLRCIECDEMKVGPVAHRSKILRFRSCNTRLELYRGPAPRHAQRSMGVGFAFCDVVGI